MTLVQNAPALFDIWSNYDPIDTDDWEKLGYAENFEDVTDEYEKFEIMEEDHDDDLNCDRENLKIAVKGNIYIFGNIGRWDGWRFGFKNIKSNHVSDCLEFEPSCDCAKWFIDQNGDLCSEQSHHDGTNYLVYREANPDLDEDDIYDFTKRACAGKVSLYDPKYTKPLGKYICDVFGWELPPVNVRGHWRICDYSSPIWVKPYYRKPKVKTTSPAQN